MVTIRLLRLSLTVKWPQGFKQILSQQNSKVNLMMRILNMCAVWPALEASVESPLIIQYPMKVPRRTKNREVDIGGVGPLRPSDALVDGP